MIIRATVISFALAGLVVLGACGSGSSGPDASGASLALQIEGPRASSDATSDPSFPPFGDPLAVTAARIVVNSGNDHCCVKFDPGSSAFDSRREIVLTGFNDGPVSVDVEAFASARVPAADDTNKECTVKRPIGVGQACDQLKSCAEVSLSPNAIPTATLVEGEETVVRVPLATRPFVVSAAPACDENALVNPVPLQLVVGELVRELDPKNHPRCTCQQTVLRCDGLEPSISLQILQTEGSSTGACAATSTTSTSPISILVPSPSPQAPIVILTPIAIPTPIAVISPPGPVCCRDEPHCTASRSCCTTEPSDDDFAASDYVLSGMKINATVFGLEAGCAEARVTTTQFPSGTGIVRNAFHVPTPPTPTATPTLTPTPTITPTGTGNDNVS